MRALFTALLFSVLAAGVFAGAGGRSIFANVPVKNPRYPAFNDAGHRTSLISGEQATIINTRQIDIGRLEFIQYPGDGSARVVTRMTAPVASVFEFDSPAPRIEGKENVRLAHEDELDVTGEDWAYDHARQKLTINKNARILYKAPLKNILGRSATDQPDSQNPPAALESDETLVTADSLALTQNETNGTTLAVLKGNVVITSVDGLRLDCDHLEITAARLRDKDPALTPLDKFQLLVATGNVRLTQGARTVTCGRADVFPRESRITLTQNAVVTDTELKITAAGDPLVLHRADRRIEGKTGRFILPPWQATGTEPRAENAKLENTVITAGNFVMRETPDGLTHANLDENVTVAATDTRLTCDHLVLAVTPQKQPAPDAPAPKIAPLQHFLATGNVHLAQASREATGGQAEILPNEDKIILTQNPVLIDHEASATASADIFTLQRLERRLTAENNVRITLPPIKDLSANTPQSPAASPDIDTVVTSRTLTMWTTPDELSHAVFAGDVHLEGTNLDLACNHLTVDADPRKTGAPPQPPKPDSTLDPKLQTIASKILLLVATGDVRFKQLSREVTSGRAEIIPAEDRITLTENPVIIDRSNPDETVTFSSEKLTLIRGEENIEGEKIKITRTTTKPQP
ncbi:lipopolysaccharide export system protein LptA [Ereboglobus sp. PH5-5]|uniref:hypothetical protein n=1 Tax=Ereboglobus sp. PH5-5 TaxID=2940529 RepID=UPI0024062306|nr:hypothetical protein [Ereboglobus sp. PH5-5]MDF9833157.1 lipopolysaccharide export system protein LptA [Ereboglobus sp. PH5-5]